MTGVSAPGRHRLRAVWRLARCTAFGLHALAVVVFVFPRLDPTQRQARIQWWSRGMLRRLDVRLALAGEFATGGCLLVANHVSWLDILAIQAVCPRARFVSKADVKSWPLLARVIDAGGTLYLERERKRDALRVVHAMADVLAAGGTLVVFPEGTTGDGRTLLPFHGNLLQAAIATDTPVQPVAVRYGDADHVISSATDFAGDTTLVRSMWNVATANGLTVHLRPLPLQRARSAGRRVWAARLRAQIAAALEPSGQASPSPPEAPG